MTKVPTKIDKEVLVAYQEDVIKQMKLDPDVILNAPLTVLENDEFKDELLNMVYASPIINPMFAAAMPVSIFLTGFIMCYKLMHRQAEVNELNEQYGQEEK